MVIEGVIGWYLMLRYGWFIDLSQVSHTAQISRRDSPTSSILVILKLVVASGDLEESLLTESSCRLGRPSLWSLLSLVSRRSHWSLLEREHALWLILLPALAWSSLAHYWLIVTHTAVFLKVSTYFARTHWGVPRFLRASDAHCSYLVLILHVVMQEPGIVRDLS